MVFDSGVEMGFCWLQVLKWRFSERSLPPVHSQDDAGRREPGAKMKPWEIQ